MPYVYATIILYVYTFVLYKLTELHCIFIIYMYIITFVVEGGGANILIKSMEVAIVLLWSPSRTHPW